MSESGQETMPGVAGPVRLPLAREARSPLDRRANHRRAANGLPNADARVPVRSAEVSDRITVIRVVSKRLDRR